MSDEMMRSEDWMRDWVVDQYYLALENRKIERAEAFRDYLQRTNAAIEYEPFTTWENYRIFIDEMKRGTYLFP